MPLSPLAILAPSGALAGTPLRAAVGFAAAMCAGDTDAALAYFAADASLLTTYHAEVRGVEAIGRVLASLADPTRRLEIRPGRTMISGPVALCSQSWRMVPADPNVLSCHPATKATLLLHQTGPGWRIAVATPWADRAI